MASIVPVQSLKNKRLFLHTNVEKIYNMLSPRRLLVLREFVAQGTIAGAADALAFTPSAVSQQLAQLQREAGVELFRKRGRRLELTDAGRMLAARAGDVLAGLEELEADLAREAGEVRGVVRVAAFQTALRARVLPALARLRAAHPRLQVQVTEYEGELSLPLLARGGLDVAVAEEYEHAPRPLVPELHRDYLDADELLLALPRGHEAARGGDAVRLGALRGERWAAARDDTSYADMFARICRSAGGFEPDVRHRVNDLGLLMDLVAAEGVVSIVPALGEPAGDARVAVRRIADGTFTRALFVATRSADRGRPSTAAVVDAIRGTS
jgi:DNA-binding transcriptional LysR family regulator